VAGENPAGPETSDARGLSADPEEAQAPPPRPVSVAFISPHAQLGGSERYLELLLDQVGPEWVNRVISLADGPFVGRLRSLGHDVDVLDTPARLGMIPAAWRLRRRLLARPPDVVHANGVKAALLAGHALLGTGIPVIWVKHDLYWDGRLARVVAARCRRVVSVSSAAAHTFGARLGDRLAIVPNALPPLTLEPGAGRDLALELAGVGDDAEIVALIGRLHRAKGQHEAVELAAELRSARPRLRWLLVGDEDRYQTWNAAALRARVAELELEDVVRFTGYRQDVLPILAGCDVAIVPSGPDERGMGREGFGLAALEAMAVGTPVVGYADGGLPEVLGPCGLLTPPGDRGALGQALVRVLDEPGLASRLAACGRARVRQRFQLGTLVAAMRRHYAEVASGR